jgi:hypothetical protein
MTGVRGPRQVRQARGVALAVGLYALVLAVAPAFHHDLACHLKSPTHCTTCLVSVTAPRADGAAGLVVADLQDAGVLRADLVGSPERFTLSPRVGRSPPA